MNRWIEKQRHLIDFTASSLARRKGKSLGLLVVYTLLVFVLASVSLYTHALRNEATRVLAGTPEIVLQRLIAGRHDLVPPGYIERIGRIRGVQQITGSRSRTEAHLHCPRARSRTKTRTYAPSELQTAF